MELPKIFIKPSHEKVIYNRHLWLFSGAISRKDPAKDGDIVQLHLSSGKLVGYGFYIDGPSIKVKIFEYTDTPKDVLGYDYWREKINNAFFLRTTLFGITDAYRLIYAEGDFFPGLIIDVYKNIAVVQTYHRGIDLIFDNIIKALQELGLSNIYIKKVAKNSKIPLGWLEQKAQAHVEIREYGLRFLIDIEQGQKTGFYLDQRDNRKLIERYACGRNVLNLFSYTGGFSLYALRAEAKLVHSVDQSENALQLAQQNIALNNFDLSKHEVFASDCFDFIDNSDKDFYDLIIVDPPAFAKSKQSIPNALRGYKEINKRVMRKIRHGGIIFTFSCSQRIEPHIFRRTVFSAASEVGRNVRIIHTLSQGVDHPINIFHPETEYLKGLVLYVE